MVEDSNSNIVLMVQNSHRVFCYFNISSKEIKDFEDNYGEGIFKLSKPFLKVYSIKKGIKKEIKNIEMDVFARNWYLELDKSDVDIFVELGRKLPNGHFVSMLISNTVTTPRDAESEDKDIYYINLSESSKKNKILSR